MSIELCERRVTATKDTPNGAAPTDSGERQRCDRLAPVSNAVGGAILGTAFAGVIGALVGGVIGAGMPYIIRLLTGHN